MNRTRKPNFESRNRGRLSVTQFEASRARVLEAADRDRDRARVALGLLNSRPLPLWRGHRVSVAVTVCLYIM